MTGNVNACGSPRGNSNGLLDVIVVNWNAGELLVKCVNSVFHSVNAGELLGRVIVVDNGSVDESLRAVEVSDDPRLTVIRNKENIGFAAACNQGVRFGGSKFILFLNPDVVLEPDVLDRTSRVMLEKENSNVAICGIQLRDNAGNVARTCCRRPTVATMFAQAIGIDRLSVGRNVTYIMKEWDHLETRFVHHVIGAYYMIRREVFEAIRGFDERFFMYFEDLDLSTRVAGAGWKCLYIADVTSWHEGGGTSKRILGKRLFYSISSRVQYAFKHFGVSGGSVVCAGSVLIEPFTRVFVLLTRREFSAIRFTFDGYVLVLKWLINGGNRHIE